MLKKGVEYVFECSPCFISYRLPAHSQIEGFYGVLVPLMRHALSHAVGLLMDWNPRLKAFGPHRTSFFLGGTSPLVLRPVASPFVMFESSVITPFSVGMLITLSSCRLVHRMSNNSSCLAASPQCRMAMSHCCLHRSMPPPGVCHYPYPEV